MSKEIILKIIKNNPTYYITEHEVWLWYLYHHQYK